LVIENCIYRRERTAWKEEMKVERERNEQRKERKERKTDGEMEGKKQIKREEKKYTKVDSETRHKIVLCTCLNHISDISMRQM